MAKPTNPHSPTSRLVLAILAEAAPGVMSRDEMAAKVPALKAGSVLQCCWRLAKLGHIVSTKRGRSVYYSIGTPVPERTGADLVAGLTDARPVGEPAPHAGVKAWIAKPVDGFKADVKVTIAKSLPDQRYFVDPAQWRGGDLAAEWRRLRGRRA